MAVAYTQSETNVEHWYCIYTKPKMEEYVSHRLTTIPDIEVFNPKLKMRGFNRGRFKEMIQELFPCYIFSCFDPSRYHHLINNTRGIRKIVGDRSGSPQIVDEEIIRTIRSRMKDGFVFLEDSDRTFKIEDKVVVKEGVFKGLNGIFLKDLKARDRVLILMSALVYQPTIEIEKCFLARV